MNTMGQKPSRIPSNVTSAWNAFSAAHHEVTPDDLANSSELNAAWRTWQAAWKACDAAASLGAKPFGYYWVDDDYDNPGQLCSGVFFGDPAQVLDGNEMIPLYTRAPST